jgi:hypothetical protein
VARRPRLQTWTGGAALSRAYDAANFITLMASKSCTPPPTRWAPISVSGNVEELGPSAEKSPLPKARPTHQTSRHNARPTPVKQAAVTGWFGIWSVPQAEMRSSARHKTARR